jgi:hypothetical protein
MRYQIEAGTDAASLLLFDPGALPADFDGRHQSDPALTLERLEGEGRACWIDSGGDGRFLLHAYVDEPIPASLSPFLGDAEVLEDFRVPSGRLYLTGAEYAFRDDDHLLRKYPHMGGSVTIPAGVYRLLIHRASYPKGNLEARFRAEASPWEYRTWQSMRGVVPTGIAAWIGLVVIFFTNVRVPFPNLLAPVLGLIFALPFLVRRLEPYRSAKDRYAQLEREFPAMVARLERFVAFLD